MSEDIQSAVTKLTAYALRTELIAQEDIIYAVNCIIRELKLDFIQDLRQRSSTVRRNCHRNRLMMEPVWKVYCGY